MLSNPRRDHVTGDLMATAFPKYIADKLSGAPPSEGQRHHEMTGLTLQMVGERIPDDEIFQAIRQWIPDRDKSDREIRDLINGAHARNPQPATGAGITRPWQASRMRQDKPDQPRAYIAPSIRQELPDDLASTTPAEFLAQLFAPDEWVCITWADERGGLSRDEIRTCAEWQEIYEAKPGA